MTGRAALYVRVSTEDQHLSNQLPDLEAMAKARGFVVVKTYSEKASAWVKGGKRPALDQCLLDAHQGRFDVLIIWALDRLTRQGPRVALATFDRLIDAKVDLLIYTQPFISDISGPMGEAIKCILAAIDEYESDQKSERVKAGMNRAAAAGQHLGRPRAHVDETAIAALLDDGKSHREIARILGLSRSMVRRRIQGFDSAEVE